MKRLVILLLVLTLLYSAAAGEETSLNMENNHRVFYEIFVGSFSDSDGDGVSDDIAYTYRLKWGAWQDDDDGDGLSN
jgi:hypothetical protein